MDAKLKALKVADLRAVLAAAAVHVPAKATKLDLIARIQASQPALAAYAALYPPADDLLAPPEEVDWNVDQPEPAAVPAPVPAAAPVVASPASPPKPEPTIPKPTAFAKAPIVAADPPATTTTDVDPEVEKRRQRAARFGIPFVEPKPQAQPKIKAVKLVRATSPAKALAGVDPKKLEERAARFGTVKPAQPTAAAKDNSTPAPTSRKRAAPPVQELDAEELERRKKRAERFGVPTKP